MNLAKIYSRAGVGLDAPRVTIEAHISSGLPTFVVVGLPETTVKESKERVRSAIINSNFKFPSGRITISLAPANLPKKGGRYDLPIAISILIASGQITLTKDIQNIEFYGELGLDGLLNPIDGLFPSVLQASYQNNEVIIPSFSDKKLAIIKSININLANNLLEVCSFLSSNASLPLLQKYIAPVIEYKVDLTEVKGQFLAKRALEIAASGGHNLLFFGTPGAGKTMLAERMTTIMPPLEFSQSLEVMAVYSVANKNFDLSIGQRPFRSPHHLASAVALVGGGANPKPGEISLAHHGILFLDEFPEFSRTVLEVLRQPLESGIVNISRAKRQVSYPANFQLIAAQNPCPCGYFGDNSNRCHCTSEQITKYKNKVSGPLLDRIDLKLNIQAVDKKEILTNNTSSESSKQVRDRVIKAYNIQIQRQGKFNSSLSGKELESIVQLNQSQKQIMADYIDKLNLSARAFVKVLKVARTVADLDNSKGILDAHLFEALSYQR